MGYIYKITNTVNKKSYIGYSERPESRWTGHKRGRGSLLVFQAIKKYGLDNFIFEVIAQDIVENEDKYIQENNTLVPNGYNLCYGGGLPPNHKGKSYTQIYGNEQAEIQRLKRQNKQLERGGYGPVKHKEETKRKISKAVSGENNPMFGKVHSNESKKKISKANKGRLEGANNPRAKKWKLISPAGKEYIANGNLKNLCKELGLSYATVHSSHIYNRSMRSGWKIEELL